jgi:hypothetical protein
MGASTAYHRPNANNAEMNISSSTPYASHAHPTAKDVIRPLIALSAKHSMASKMASA